MVAIVSTIVKCAVKWGCRGVEDKHANVDSVS